MLVCVCVCMCLSSRNHVFFPLIIVIIIIIIIIIIIHPSPLQTKEAEVWYKQCVTEANVRHASLLRLKRDVLVQLRELILQCDQTMKGVTVCYFQLQHTVAAPAPVQVYGALRCRRVSEDPTFNVFGML